VNQIIVTTRRTRFTHHQTEFVAITRVVGFISIGVEGDSTVKKSGRALTLNMVSPNITPVA
jgi:hypothetical protein